MASVINQILAAGIDIAVQEAEANKAAILAAAAAAGVNAEKAADIFIDSIKLNGALGLVAGALKGALHQAVAQAVAAAGAEEPIVFELLISAAKNEAAKLAA